MQNDPEIIFSPFCGTFEKDDRTVEVNIFRVEPNTTWHLEVINEMNTSTVWDDPFVSDADAYAEFMATVEEEGMGAFEDVPRVIHWMGRAAIAVGLRLLLKGARVMSSLPS